MRKLDYSSCWQEGEDVRSLRLPSGSWTDIIILAWVKASVNKELFLCLALSFVHVFLWGISQGEMASLAQALGLRHRRSWPNTSTWITPDVTVLATQSKRTWKSKFHCPLLTKVWTWLYVFFFWGTKFIFIFLKISGTMKNKPVAIKHHVLLKPEFIHWCVFRFPNFSHWHLSMLFYKLWNSGVGSEWLYLFLNDISKHFPKTVVDRKFLCI